MRRGVSSRACTRVWGRGTTYPVDALRRVHLELAHRCDQALCRVDNVCRSIVSALVPKARDGARARTFVDGESEHEQLVSRVAVLVDDLHLLDDRRLARFARACVRCDQVMSLGAVCVRMQGYGCTHLAARSLLLSSLSSHPRRSACRSPCSSPFALLSLTALGHQAGRCSTCTSPSCRCRRRRLPAAAFARVCQPTR